MKYNWKTITLPSECLTDKESENAYCILFNKKGATFWPNKKSVFGNVNKGEFSLSIALNSEYKLWTYSPIKKRYVNFKTINGQELFEQMKQEWVNGR